MELLNEPKVPQPSISQACGTSYLFIFGSSVTDYCSKDSDIDICLDIEGSTKGMDLFEVSKNISKVCGYNCDMLTYGKLQGKIKEEVDTKGVVVYELS